MRTLLAGEAEGVCSGGGGGVVGSAGEIEAGDSSGVVEEVGDGDSCARRAEAKNTNRIATFVLIVISRIRDISY
jgi:hypothetical protein